MSDKGNPTVFWSLSRTAVLLQGGLWYTLLLPSDAKAATQRALNLLQLCYYCCKTIFQTNSGKWLFFLSCFISWTPKGDFFSFFESSTNRRKTRGKKGENRWYLDLNNPQLILRKYQWYKKPAAVAEFYGTRFPFLSPFVAFLWYYRLQRSLGIHCY